MQQRLVIGVENLQNKSGIWNRINITIAYLLHIYTRKECSLIISQRQDFTVS